MPRTTKADVLFELIRTRMRAIEDDSGAKPTTLYLPDSDELLLREEPNQRLFGTEGAKLTMTGSREEWRAFLRNEIARRLGLRVRFGGSELGVS